MPKLKILLIAILLLFAQTVSALPYMNYAITGGLAGSSTATNKIILNWSENVSSAQKNDFGVGNNCKSCNILSASTNGNMVTLTLNYSLKTNETPVVYYNKTWYGGVKNLSDDIAEDQNITPADGLSPTMDSCSATSKYSINMLFSENLNSSTVNVSDFNVTNNIVTGTLPTNNTVKIFLEQGMSNETPAVSLPGSVYDVSGNMLSSAGQILCSDGIQPAIEINMTPLLLNAGENITIMVNITDGSGINSSSVKATIKEVMGNETNELALYNDGNHSDMQTNDSVYGNTWNTSNANGTHTVTIYASDMNGNEKSKMTVFSVSPKAADMFSNSSLALEENRSFFVDASEKTNATLNISVSGNVTASISIIRYSQNPLSNLSGYKALDKYIEIVADNETAALLNWVILRIQYNDTDISARGLNESSLKIHYYNDSSGTWEGQATIVNETGNYAETNMTHFSFYSVYGSVLPYCGDGSCNAGETCSSCSSDCGSCPLLGGGGGGIINITTTCTENWVCSDWPSDCTNSMKTRSCTDRNNCGTQKNKPIELQLCEICAAGATVCIENDLMQCSDGKTWAKAKTCEYKCVEDRCITAEEEAKAALNVTPIIPPTIQPSADLITGLVSAVDQPAVYGVIIIVLIVAGVVYLRKLKKPSAPKEEAKPEEKPKEEAPAKQQPKKLTTDFAPKPKEKNTK